MRFDDNRLARCVQSGQVRARRRGPQGGHRAAGALLGPGLLAAALLAAGCAKIAELDGGAPTTTPADAPAASISAAGRSLNNAAVGRHCENGTASCALPVEPGALPRRALAYRLAPGDEWWGDVERQQQCADDAGNPHGEAVKASVHAVITAADAAGNLLMESTVTDVIVSDPDVDTTTVLEFPLGARTSALFSSQGITIRPLKPPTYAAALITPVPAGEVGVGATWEIRAPGGDLNGVRQLQLIERNGDAFRVEGVAGDWLDDAHTRQRITEATATVGRLDQVGPQSRAIEVTNGVGCFKGHATGSVQYFVTQTDAPDLDGDGSPG